ncbi:ABC transporter permease subunit [Cellulosimicrobium sp. CUA-896]|uniref:ABC transporter permease subunit n=1 Tax=Cellulosimicrobium sp. CUA-896 TaxID=1517881 RepID=UPI0021010034|nr:ABC transporter permease subunit [Cellulosimicrobium sp. CUA-896]
MVVEFFRGTSLVVQFFWLFFVLPVFGFKMESLAVGIVALGLNYGAYGARWSAARSTPSRWGSGRRRRRSTSARSTACVA